MAGTPSPPPPTPSENIKEKQNHCRIVIRSNTLRENKMKTKIEPTKPHTHSKHPRSYS